MDVDRKRAEAVFLAALELTGEQRVRLLEQECAGDAPMRTEVCAMLDAAESSEAYFEGLSERFGAALRLEGGAEHSPTPPAQIGPYRPVSLLGRGGMGTVWLAERVDEQYEQRVALKLLPLGLASEAGERRFLAERQILARLVHPGIARLLDGGVNADGTPWFAMDYVQGEPIDGWCDRRCMDIDARLRLWLQVCGAVEYAHANLVVHRDLKPANVLVDLSGRVRLLDFGIAKVLDTTDDALNLTRVEGRPLTPLYASPEMLSGDPVTTAADVYALGALLYLLLCGNPPFELDGLTGSEITRRVSDQIPALPSVALAKGIDQAAVQIARQRNSGPERLAGRLRGDLDTIVMKALAKEPSQRYRSVEQFALDVQRHLQGQPVQARAPTLRYRARRFLRRHPAGVAAGMLVFTLLSVIVSLTVQYSLATARQSVQIAAERDRAEQIKVFLLELFQEASPNQSRGLEVTAREMLDRGATRVTSELAGQPLTQADLLLALGDIYGSLSEYEPALSLLDEALALRREAGDDSSAAYADALASRAYLAGATGHYAAEQTLREEVLALQRRLGDEAAIGNALLRLGVVLHRRRDLSSAQRHYGEALAIGRSLPDAPTDLLPSTLHALGGLLDQQGETIDAIALHEEGLALRLQLHGEDHLELIESYFTLGDAQHSLGQFDAAKANIEQALAVSRRLTPEGNADDAFMLNTLGKIEEARGDRQAAEAYYRDALAVLRRHFDRDHPNVGVVSANLGLLLGNLEGRAREAAAILVAALDTLQSKVPEHPKIQDVQQALKSLQVQADVTQ